jgi:hypothetical protein
MDAGQVAHDLSPSRPAHHEGWDVKRTASGRKVWLNHRTRKTSWVDPVTQTVSKVCQLEARNPGQAFLSAPLLATAGYSMRIVRPHP